MVSNIWVAAADNQYDIVQQYISSGQFTANSKDENGYTPIHAAVSYGHLELLQFLIDNGGDINVQDNEGDTPLHHVEDLTTAKYLVEKLAADYKRKNNDNMTPGQYIEDDGEFPDVAQYLLSLSHDKPEQNDGGSFLSSLPVPGDIDGHQIRYTMEEDNENAQQLSPEELEERRKKLEAVLTSENPEEALRELVQNAVHEGLREFKQQQEPQDDEPSMKKSKN
jgi:ankyrin repeat protein